MKQREYKRTNTTKTYSQTIKTKNQSLHLFSLEHSGYFNTTTTTTKCTQSLPLPCRGRNVISESATKSTNLISI